MAVELNIYVQENCDSLYVFDQTGKYDKKCNKTGWGSPNKYKLLDAISAEIHIYPPGSEEPIVIDVYPDFPVDNNVGYEILPEDLGLEKFKSGIWRFDYQVRVSKNGVEELLFTSCSKFLKNDLKCCLDSKKMKVDTSNFDSPEVKKSNDICALFKSAEYNARHGKLDETEKIIEVLYVKCNCPC
jgi:hypothetical protein